MKKLSFVCILSLSLCSCATEPQIVVDPGSITDVAKYHKDLEECRTLSMSYTQDKEKATGAGIGAVAALGTAAAVLATGGMYLLPSGAAVVGGGGAAIGAQRATGKENNAQEQIWAQCMEKRGYSAYTSK
tara:strand:+ start:170 stop:559 length:390 start_codon:yes stop_codon:yes gene_type:complete